MSKAPTYQSHQIRFRDATDSHKQNEQTNDVFYDLIELFNLGNSLQAESNKIREFFEVGSHFSQQHVNQMEIELDRLRDRVKELQSSGREYTRTIQPSEMQADNDVPEHERALIDKVHNLVTLRPSAKSNSKLYLYDEVNNEYIVPSTLSYDISPAADGVTIVENDFSDALTPDEFKFWHRKYNYNVNQQEATCQIVLKLPDNIISSRDINMIYVHPFPLNTMDIMNVEYQLNGGWRQLPGFKPIERAGDVKFCFSPTGMSEIRLTLRQTMFIQKGGRNVFHMGLRDIGVFYDDFQSTIGRFDADVDLNERFLKKEILSIKPIFQNDGSLSLHQSDIRQVSFKVYEVDDTGKTIYKADRFPIQVDHNKIRLKCIIQYDRNTKATPALTGVELTFKGDS
ncbi:hypothetical protein ACK8P5_26690 (plasmid) [Paenibacillus sp. EC2-1]|uniref:hypothetical protein n=1 Tax=Paenibacillus sp. EC2-1 TaxID=3388665 RepID=UPI003BEF001B